jgi:ubiquinone/menaquinone biosynthesis C-methylase UbiE
MVMSVRMASTTASMPAAIEQALALFQPERRPADAKLRDGYLDFLGQDDPLDSYLGHKVLRSRLGPALYESVTHPIAMRLAAGLKAPGRRGEQRIALELMDISAGDRVLDIACGPGNYTRSYAAAVGDGLVVGFDPSQGMLSAAARLTPGSNVAYIRGDGCDLPFQAASFDAVSCFGGMHFFERPMHALKEIVRVLEPGGRVALLTSCAKLSKAPADGPSVRKRGLFMFKRNEITGALRDLGLVDVEQRIMRVVQIVSARKPAI